MFLRHPAALGAALLGSLVLAPLAGAQARAAIYDSAQVEAILRAYFADIPAMVEVARCESRFRQFAADGTTLTDPSNSWIGAFQVSRIHSAKATAMGYDLDSLEGNMMYARFLYQQSELGPWRSSESCWGPATAGPVAGQAQAARSTPTAMSTVDAETPAIDIPLRLGMEGGSVVALQQALNGSGFTVAQSGPGSPGEETERFGALTRAAGRAFQCAKLSLRSAH